MKEIYTHQTLNQFFEEYKNLPNLYKIEKVHQLLNNPNAKATHKVDSHFKHLKLIIMTSAFIIGVLSILLWLTPKESEQIDKVSGPIFVPNEPPISNENDNPRDIGYIKKASFSKEKKINTVVKLQKKVVQSNQSLTMLNDSVFKEENIGKDGCQWPADTTIDKKLLIIHLTNEELEKLGVYNRNDSMKYKNITPDGKHNLSRTFLWADYGGKWPYTKLPFYMIDLTDTLNTDYSRNLFNCYDTLVAVQTIITNKPFILWFTPHPAIFNSLPDRYSYLKEVYGCLKQIKKLNPEQQIVNFWKKVEISLLDSINYLELSKETLQELGFQFYKDSISLTHPDIDMYYLLGRKEAMMGTTAKGKKVPYPPNPLPVLVTDEKGNIINYYGQDKSDNKEIDYTMFDLLIPVKISFDKYVSTRNYSHIFWFYPTDDFIDALPENIKYDLKSERNKILQKSLNTQNSCTYFEVCKSTLQIDNFKLYPNPASYSFTIEFYAMEEFEGSISIVNIAGARLKTLIPNSTFLSGHNSYQMDLSGITSGIYLISINTDKGFKTQRLIVSQ
jgi:hypothetical protein